MLKHGQMNEHNSQLNIVRETFCYSQKQSFAVSSLSKHLISEFRQNKHNMNKPKREQQ